MNPPAISIIIVNWNTRFLLCQCLAALGTHDFEVIVVDNGSADGSVDACRESFPAVQLLVNSCNLGFAKACNLGARQAKGSLLLFLNSDAQVSAESIRRLASAMDETGAHMAGPKLVYPDGSIQAASARNLPTPLSEFVRNVDVCGWLSSKQGELKDYDCAQEVECVSGAAMMIRQTVWRDVGGWPENYFMYAEDIDLCKRVLEAGFHIWYVPQCAVRHLNGGSSKGGATAKIRRSWRSFVSMTKFMTRHYGRIHGLLYALQYPPYMGTLTTRKLCRALWRKRKPA
jgi:GT2 family glycosyltransferase